MVSIIISRTRQKKFYFTVECPQQETLLTSGFYTSKTACKKGINALKNAVLGVGRYQWIENNNNTVSFIIKSTNGQKLASSQLFNSLPESTGTLSMLKTEIPDAFVVDRSQEKI